MTTDNTRSFANVVRLHHDRHLNPWNVIQKILTECDHDGVSDWTRISMIRGLAETALANHDRHSSPGDVAYEYLDSIVRPQFD